MVVIIVVVVVVVIVINVVGYTLIKKSNYMPEIDILRNY